MRLSLQWRSSTAEAKPHLVHPLKTPEAPPQPASARSKIQAAFAKPHFRLGLVMVVGLFVRLAGLTRYPLNGDEYNSLHEAARIGLNWQSLVYSLLLRGWMSLGVSDGWLRLLSVLLGLGTVWLVFLSAGKVFGTPWDMAAGLLAATSPFLLYHAQEVRFYALFIFSTALFLYLLIRWITAGRTSIELLGLALAALLLTFSHFLGILVVTAGLLFALSSGAPGQESGLRYWSRMALLALALLLLLTIPLFPPIQQGLWRLYQSIAHTTSASPIVTTLPSLLTLAKMTISTFVLLMGYHVFPLDLWLVLPSLLVFLPLITLGAWKLLRDIRWAGLVVFYGIVFLGVYLVLDTTGGRLAGGVAPRHVAFLAPLVTLLVVGGLSLLPPRWATIILGLALLANLAGLLMRWSGDWSYGDLTDYRLGAQFSAENLPQSGVILHDGRSADPIQRYFPDQFTRLVTWSFDDQSLLPALAGADHTLFISNDYQEDRREELNRLLGEIEQAYAWTAGRVEYPFFQYVFERKPVDQPGYPVIAETGQIRQPLSIYGLEFQDLALPVDLEFEGIPLQIVGAFSLSAQPGEQTRSIPLSEPVTGDELLLLTTVVDAVELQPGDEIARVTLTSANGATQTFPLSLGEETQAWDQMCPPDASCETVYQWHKRLALLGQRAYPQAWQDFQAGLHAVQLPVPDQENIANVTVDYLAANGQLAIWAMGIHLSSSSQ